MLQGETIKMLNVMSKMSWQFSSTVGNLTNTVFPTLFPTNEVFLLVFTV